MYGKSSEYYDIIYGYKDYEKEAVKLDEFVKTYKKSSGNALLDVACGTGNHITHLKRLYSVEGLDINPEMLKQARRKHPDIAFHKGDMGRFSLGKQYDVITCLFSAIGHLKTKTRLRQAIAQMAKHLKPGGVLLVEPWLTPDHWSVGHFAANFVDKPDVKLARMSISRRKGNLSINDEHHLIASNKGIEYFVERLEMGLFTDEEYRDAFRAARLDVNYDKDGLMGRGLYVGTRRLD